MLNVPDKVKLLVIENLLHDPVDGLPKIRGRLPDLSAKSADGAA
jgi:hypothetical protein